MNNQRVIFFGLLLAYLFTPAIFNWIISPTGTWYKPFIVWVFIIIGAFLLQKYNKAA